MKKLIYIVLGTYLIASLNVSAVEFNYSSRFPNNGTSGNLGGVARQLTIRGAIEKGDTDKFFAFLRANSVDAHFGLLDVMLDSPGGDVIEAMKLSDALKEFYPDTHVTDGTCASSCLLLWLAGGVHFLPNTENKIGIHRPFFDKQYFAKLPMHDAESQYDKLNERFKSFVLKQGLPQSIYEKLIATPSNSIYWLNTQDLNLIGFASPAYDERFKSQCGTVDQSQKRKCRNTMLGPDRKNAWNNAMASGSKIVYKWNKVNSLELATAYADTSSINDAGDNVKMLSLFDYKNTSVALGEERKYNSAIAQYEFDCNGQQLREIANSLYSGHMGGGSIVYSKVDVRQWMPISKHNSGSLFYLWQFACKTIKP